MKTVMAFGTFDTLHPGHSFFLQEAKKLGDRLVVVIARDSTVLAVKGHTPYFKEEQRKKAIELMNLADEVVLGDKNNKYLPIREHKPNLIALGYDQNAFVVGLQDMFPKIGIVRLPSFFPERYKSSKLRPALV